MKIRLAAVHPFTGLTAIGFRRNGAPIWPVMGGDGTTDAPAGAAAPETPAGSAPEAAKPASDANASKSGEFDPSQLSPEARKWLEGQLAKGRADADAKARTASKENAKAEITKAIADALGITPKEVDPAEVARQLTAAQTEARTARIDRAVDRAARKAGADEDLVGAVLARKGALGKLDPSADDFEARVAELVKAEVEANPRLKLDPPAAVPAPGAQGATANFSAGNGERGKRLGLGEAIAAKLAGSK